MNAVELEGLTRRFGDTLAVAGLTLGIAEGEIFALVGPDGAGKTTTLRMLTEILDPTSGRASVLGFDTVREAESIKEEIGYMSQRFGLYPDLRVEENLQFYADVYGVPRRGREEKIDRLLAFSNMQPFKKRLAGNLSGGMKQKLGLACALIHTPRVLFLDEPTNGVDPVSRRDFWAILYQLVKDGLTVLLSTAYLDEAERCNRVALMYQGRSIRQAPPDKLASTLDANCYEVRSADPRGARMFLQARADILSADASGDALHVFVNPGGSIDKVASDLEQAGYGAVKASLIRPSLEDLFIALVRSEQLESHMEAVQ